jgi:hypothetical protein
VTPEEAEATALRAALDQARAAADEQARIQKDKDAAAERMRKDGR